MKTMRIFCAGLVILLTVTFSVRAQQYDTPSTNTEIQDRTTRSDMDDPNSPQYKYAVSMSKDIMNKLSLSFEQAEKIRDILLDYQQDVLDVKSRNTNYNGNNNAIGNNRTAENENGEMVGGSGNVTDKVEAYQDADTDANDKIEDVLEVKQIVKYNDIKKNWWASIKQHVHSEKAFNELYNNRNNDKTGKNNSKDMDNTRIRNTKGTD